MLQPLDSCDASGEYTTEESEGERQSISSDDLQSSVATYRRFEGALAISQSPSQEILDYVQKTPVNEISPDENTPKVVMRSKQHYRTTLKIKTTYTFLLSFAIHVYKISF